MQKISSLNLPDLFLYSSQTQVNHFLISDPIQKFHFYCKSVLRHGASIVSVNSVNSSQSLTQVPANQQEIFVHLDPSIEDVFSCKTYLSLLAACMADQRFDTLRPTNIDFNVAAEC